MDSAELWRWLWLAVALGAISGEIALAGSFFLLPFAVGAGAAAVLSFVGVGALGSWAAFVGFTVIAFLALRPLARRLDRNIGPGPSAGAERLIGEMGLAIGTATSVEPALVRIGGEEWMARPAKAHVPAGSAVEVVGLSGTHLLVVPRGGSTQFGDSADMGANSWLED